MSNHSLEELRRQFTGKFVVVDPALTELARWAGMPGEIKAITATGHALVQFEGADRGWHDLDLEHLREAPRPEPAE